MTTTAIYPGSFDPVTRGHEDVVRRSLAFSDRVIVGVAQNVGKPPLFTLDERLGLLQEVLGEIPNVEVCAFEGLLVDFARKARATLVVRGLRAVSDFEYEFQMALMNRELHRQLETVFLMPAVQLAFLSSSLVREVAQYGGDVSAFVHPTVERALDAKFGT